jgi:prepilin-type N-terminal cleavage/methylation domain-containing protein
MLRQTKRAFTLIEILTVVTILAITSAIIIPQMGSRNDMKAAAGARVIMSDLIWAQNRAISNQQKVYVIFSGQSYTIWYRDSAGVLQKCTNPITQTTYTETFGQKNTPLADVSISGTPDFNGQFSLCFDEVGTPYGYDGTTETQMTSAGTVKIAAGDQQLTVSIEGYTGEASVQ